MSRFLSRSFPWREELADETDLPYCRFLGAIPQYEARWS